MYLYQEDDAKFKNKNEKKKDLELAMIEAEKWCQSQKAIKSKTPVLDSLKKPQKYIKIKNNRPVSPVKLNSGSEETDEADEACNCKYEDESPCGLESRCVNASLYIECQADKCPAKERCQNQCFQKGPQFKTKIMRTESKGWGLYALENIPSQHFIIEYVGEVINTDEFERRFQRAKQSKEENFYFLTLGNNLYIDAGPRGNDARFINHSCNPNCEPIKWTIKGQTRIGFFANREIIKVGRMFLTALHIFVIKIKITIRISLRFCQQGEELTFTYNWGSNPEQVKTNCHCGADNCRGYL